MKSFRKQYLLPLAVVLVFLTVTWMNPPPSTASPAAALRQPPRIHQHGYDHMMLSCEQGGSRLPPTYMDHYPGTSTLIHAPPYPNWPPGHPGPCMAYDVVYDHKQPPVFSVLVTSFNRENQVSLVLIQLLKLTTEPWELIWVDDGSTDKSLDRVLAELDRYDTAWPNCPYNETQIDEHAIWPDGSDQNESGDMGRRCTLMAPTLVRARVVRIPSTGLLEAFDNNLQMRMAHPASKFFILFQDDQFMTSPGWNTQLAQALRTYDDVFSVSMRCAHGWPSMDGGLTGVKCTNTCLGQSQPWRLYIRDSGNRGPLILNAAMTRSLGYMDEINTGLTPHADGDHELNVRAYVKHQWKSGFVPVPYTQHSCAGGIGRSPTTLEEQTQNKIVREWNAERTKLLGSPIQWPSSNMHDSERELPYRRDS